MIKAVKCLSFTSAPPHAEPTRATYIRRLPVDSTRPPHAPRAAPGYDNSTLLKYGCLSSNIVTEEAIDVVLYNSYPDAANVWSGYKLLK
jgi:hypothetical protein